MKALTYSLIFELLTFLLITFNCASEDQTPETVASSIDFLGTKKSRNINIQHWIIIMAPCHAEYIEVKRGCRRLP